MIIFFDKDTRKVKRNATLPLLEPVHMRHSLDGFPLCWSLDADDDFYGSSEENEVSCHPCLDIAKGYRD